MVKICVNYHCQDYQKQYLETLGSVAQTQSLSMVSVSPEVLEVGHGWRRRNTINCY